MVGNPGAGLWCGMRLLLGGWARCHEDGKVVRRWADDVRVRSFEQRPVGRLHVCGRRCARAEGGVGRGG